jgi:hypothetical protein
MMGIVGKVIYILAILANFITAIGVWCGYTELTVFEQGLGYFFVGVFILFLYLYELRRR